MSPTRATGALCTLIVKTHKGNGTQRLTTRLTLSHRQVGLDNENATRAGPKILISAAYSRQAPTDVQPERAEAKEFGIRRKKGAGSPGTTVEYMPSHGDLLVMRGKTNDEWEHWVPKTAKQVGERMNLTFRHR